MPCPPTLFDSIVINGYSFGVTGGVAYVNGRPIPTGLGGAVLLTGNQDITGAKSFFGDVNCYSNDAVTLSVSSKGLYDALGFPSVEWGSRVLVDTFFTNSVNWGSRLLIDEFGATNFSWSSKSLTGNWSTNGVATSNQHLVNFGLFRTGAMLTTGTQSITGDKTFYGAFKVNMSGYPLINIINGTFQLNLPDGTTAAELNSRYLTDSTSSPSVNWESKYLRNGASTNLSWASNSLSGEWKTNRPPTTTGGLVNLGYIQTGYVDTITDGQVINASKTFAAGIEIFGGVDFPVLSTFSGTIYGSDGLRSIAYENRALYRAGGTVGTLYWNVCQLVSFDNSASIDWAQRLMNDSNSNVVMSWDLKQLSTGSDLTPTLDWNNKYLSGGQWTVNPSTAGGASLVIKSGVTPTAPVSGAIWYTSGALHTQTSGRTYKVVLTSGEPRVDSVATKTTNFSFAPTDYYIVSSGVITGTLPDAATLSGKTYSIATAGGNFLLTGTNGQRINNSLSFNIGANAGMTVFSAGVGWYVVGGYNI